MTLDDDVADGLAKEAGRTGRAFRTVVNESLRRGLRTTVAEPFRVVDTGMRRRPGVEIDDIEGLLERLEGHERR